VVQGALDFADSEVHKSGLRPHWKQLCGETSLRLKRGRRQSSGRPSRFQAMDGLTLSG